MRKKSLLLMLITVVFALIISACSNDTDSALTDTEAKTDTEAVAKDELKIAMTAAPPSLDPHLSVAAVTGQIDLNIFEMLVAFDENYAIQPSLAESIEISEDGKTYTFPLRDVKFHDGKGLTSADVVASLERWGRVSPTGRSALKDVVIEAPDDKTVVLKLTAPSNTILYDLAYPTSQAAYILQKEAIDKFGDEIITEFVGTGPYKFVEWKADQYIHITENEEYVAAPIEGSGIAGEKVITYKDLYFYIVPDPTTRLNGIKSGEFDVVQQIPADQYESLKADSSITTHIVKPANYPGLIFDTTEGLFSDVKARQAIVATLNFDEILLASAGNPEFYRADPGLIMQEQTTWYTDAGVDKYSQVDPEYAKTLLKEAGYNGEEITIMATQDYQYMYNAALVIQNQLKNIGLNVNLEIYDWSTLLARRSERSNWDAFVSGFPMISQPTQTLFLDSRNNHASGYANPEMDALLDVVRYGSTTEEAYDAWEKAQELYWNDVPVIKLGDVFTFNASRDGITPNVMFAQDIYWNIKE